MNTNLATTVRRLVAASAMLMFGIIATPGLHAQQTPVAPGLSFYINAGIWGLGLYEAKPKFYTTFNHNVTSKAQKASAKTLYFAPYSGTVTFLWTKKIKIYNKADFIYSQKIGVTLQGWLGSGKQPDQYMNGWLASADLLFGPAIYPVPVVLMPPRIDAVNSLPGYYTLTGMWFGTKKPKVWIEYLSTDTSVKRLKCKVLPPTAYSDINGKVSYMSANTGESEVPFLMPGGAHPKDLDAYLGFVCIDNGVGMHYGTYVP